MIRTPIEDGLIGAEGRRLLGCFLILVGLFDIIGVIATIPPVFRAVKSLARVTLKASEPPPVLEGFVAREGRLSQSWRHWRKVAVCNCGRLASTLGRGTRHVVLLRPEEKTEVDQHVGVPDYD